MSISNFNKQTDNMTTIKQFNFDDLNKSWIFTKYENTKVLTPSDKKSNVYIPNNLVVGGTINGLSDIFL